MDDQSHTVCQGSWRFEIPSKYIRGVIHELGVDGRSWLLRLGSQLERLSERYGLTPDGDVMHGYVGLVLPVVREKQRLVLKVSPHRDLLKAEAQALRLWNGEGAVRLRDYDDESGSMLLERLDSELSLDNESIEDAVPIAAGLLRRLTLAAPPGDIPFIRDRVDSWPEELEQEWSRQGQPFDRQFIEAVEASCQRYGPSSAAYLVNEDLHYQNVLGGGREAWTLIDPKAYIGDPEFSVVPLLWNRFGEGDGIGSRFRAIVRIAELDEERACAWTLVRAVDYWLWALKSDLTHDPLVCAQIAQWALDGARS